jgi:hypothetical protein
VVARIVAAADIALLGVKLSLVGGGAPDIAALGINAELAGNSHGFDFV